jgi:acyl-CoA synthetase (AMP-forming)/AMP-acid ligase II
MYLRDFVRRCANSYPAKTAFIHADQGRTWKEMHERSSRLASALQSLGLRKGDVTGILSMNRIELAEHWFACLKIGVARAGVNWRYSSREMAHTVQDCGLKALIVAADRVPQIVEHIDEWRARGVKLIGFGPGHGLDYDYETLLARNNREPDYPVLQDGDWAMIGYTSGTTGLPKGAILSQRAVCESAVRNVLANNYTPEDVRLYVTNPAGINIFQLCFNLITGMTTVLDDYDTARFLQLIEQHRVTTVTVIPTILRRVIDELKAGHYDVSSLRQVCYGTMPITPTLIRTAYDALGCTFMQRYGVSESAGAIAALRDSDHRLALQGDAELLTSVGRTMLHADVSIRDEEGREVPPGELGTVWIRSETLMSGYLNLPEETAEALALPWLKTGDFGRMDERGYIFLGDRKKHMIISGGMNVYPLGVENVLAEHPAVREAVVIGMPHPEWGEAVVAAVSVLPGSQVTAEELIAHCRPRVAKFEAPKHVAIMDNLPQGNTNKIDKRRIKEMLRDHLPWAAEIEQ